MFDGEDGWMEKEMVELRGQKRGQHVVLPCTGGGGGGGGGVGSGLSSGV